MFQRNENTQSTVDIVDPDAMESPANRELLIRELVEVVQGRQRMSAYEFIDLVRVVNSF